MEQQAAATDSAAKHHLDSIDPAGIILADADDPLIAAGMQAQQLGGI